jgi:hypothetical protein
VQLGGSDFLHGVCVFKFQEGLDKVPKFCFL